MDEREITITLPSVLVEQISAAVENMNWSYESHEEFFKEAARMLLIDMAKTLR